MSSNSRYPKKSETLMSFADNEGTMVGETIAHDATLQALLDSNTILQHLGDERSMVREILGEQSLPSEVAKDSQVQHSDYNSTEPLMSLKSTNSPLIKQTRSPSAVNRGSNESGNSSKGDANAKRKSESPVKGNASLTSTGLNVSSRKEEKQTPNENVHTLVAEGAPAEKPMKKPFLTQRALRPPAKVKRMAEGASSNSSKRKPESAKDMADLHRNRARKAALSAFMHLHHPSMTEAEQEVFLQKYEGKDHEMWSYLASIFGESSVPERLKLSPEEIRGSMRVHLLPKLDCESGKKVMKAMEGWGIDPKGKEMVRRTTTVDELIRMLRLRWEPLDDKFRAVGHTLKLYEIDSSEPLPGNAVVRDHVNDARLEFCWVPADPDAVVCEDSWGHEHSLAAFPQTVVEMSKPACETGISIESQVSSKVTMSMSVEVKPPNESSTPKPQVNQSPASTTSRDASEPSKKRRIQPIPISTNKRILADETS